MVCGLIWTEILIKIIQTFSIKKIINKLTTLLLDRNFLLFKRRLSNWYKVLDFV